MAELQTASARVVAEGPGRTSENLKVNVHDLDEMGQNISKNLKANVDDLEEMGQNISKKLRGNEKQELRERLKRLHVAWQQIVELEEKSEVVRQRELENEEISEKQRVENEALVAEIDKVTSWLDEAEKGFKTDMFTVPEEQQMDLILKQERLCTEMQQQQLRVADILERGRASSSVQEDVRLRLDELSRRLDEVQTLSDEHGCSMEQCISEQSDYYDELEKCVVWMQETSKIMALDELDEDNLEDELSKHVALCCEISERESCVAAVVVKGKDLLKKLPREERGAIDEQLSRLQDEWQRLRRQAKDKENELRAKITGTAVEGFGGAEQGDLDNDLEREKMDYDADVAEFKKWLGNVASETYDKFKDCDMGGLQSAVDDVDSVRDEAESRRDRLVLRGQELISRMQESDCQAANDLQGEMEGLQRAWLSNKDVLSEQIQKLASAVERQREVEAKLEEVQSLVDGVAEEIHGDECHSDLERLETLLAEVEQREGELSVILCQDGTLAPELRQVEKALQSQMLRITDTIAKVKNDISKEVQQKQALLEEKNRFLEDLRLCKENIGNLENAVAEDDSAFGALDTMEKESEATADLLKLSSTGLSDLEEKSPAILSKLSPAVREVLEQQLCDAISSGKRAREKAEAKLKRTGERIQARKEFDLTFERAMGQLKRNKETLSKEEVPSDCHEVLAECEDIQRLLSEQDNPVNATLLKGQELLSSFDEDEKSIIESQMARIENFAKDVREQTSRKVAALKQRLEEEQRLQEMLKRFRLWMEDATRRRTELGKPKDASMLENDLATVKALHEDVQGKREELQDVLREGKKIAELLPTELKDSLEEQLENSKDSYFRLEQDVGDLLWSVKDRLARLEEFNKELRLCKEVLAGAESLLDAERPWQSDLSWTEAHVAELKETFQQITEAGSCIFVLEERKDAIREEELKQPAEAEYDEMSIRWKTLTKGLSEKTAAKEKALLEEQDFAMQLTEASRKVESAEQDVSSLLEAPRTSQEISERVSHARDIGERCTALEKLVEVLHDNLENCPVELEGGFSERSKEELLAFKEKALGLRSLASGRLSEAEQCLDVVNEASNTLSATKELLAQKEQLVSQDSTRPAHADELHSELATLRKLNSELAGSMKEVKNAREAVQDRVAGVSEEVASSLLEELDLVYRRLSLVCDTSDAAIAHTETQIAEIEKSKRLLTESGAWLGEVEEEITASGPRDLDRLSEYLDKLTRMQMERSQKERDLERVLEEMEPRGMDESLTEDFKRTLAAFHDLEECLSRASERAETNIATYNDCSNLIEDTSQRLTEMECAAKECAPLSLDESSVEDERAKLAELLSKLETVESSMDVISEKKAGLEVDQDGSIEDKLESLRYRCGNARDCVAQRESGLRAFLDSKEHYDQRLRSCKALMGEIGVWQGSPSDRYEVSNEPDEHAKRLERVQEFQNEIELLEEACKEMIGHSDCVKEPIEEELAKVKKACRGAKAEASRAREEMEALNSELASLHNDVEQCQAQLLTGNSAIQDCRATSTSLRGLNDFLGQLRQVYVEQVQPCGTDVESALQKGQVLLTKVKESDKRSLEESLQKLESDYHQIDENSQKKIEQAERRINDMIEFGKASSRYESLLAMHEATSPVACAETLESQADELKRLHGDLEARERCLESPVEGDVISPTVCSEVSSSPDTEGVRLGSDWQQLKASVGGKLRELERLSTVKQEFEHDLELCRAGVLEIEQHLYENHPDTIDGKMEKMHGLCSKLQCHQEKLESLTESCNEIPRSGDTDQRLSPKVRLALSIKHCEEVKEKALANLSALEQERDVREALDREICALENWAAESLPSQALPVARDSWEQTLEEDVHLGAMLGEKIESLKDLREKAKTLSDGSVRESLLEHIRALSHTLEKGEGQVKSRQEENAGLLKQSKKVATDLERCKVLLEDVKMTLHDAGPATGESWVDAKLGEDERLLGKLNSCKSFMESLEQKIDNLSPPGGVSEVTKLEQELSLLKENWEAVEEHISEDIKQLEVVQTFGRRCSELNQVCEENQRQLEEIKVCSSELGGDLTTYEESLAKCRALQQKCTEANTDYDALREESSAVLNQLPSNQREMFEDRVGRLQTKRELVDSELAECHDQLRSLVAEQQTLEGWFSCSKVVLEEGRNMLSTSSVCMEPAQRAQDVRALQELVRKVDDYEKYDGNCQQAEKLADFNTTRRDLGLLKEELNRREDQLKALDGLCGNFSENMSKLNKLVDAFRRDAEDTCCLPSAKEQLRKVEVSGILVERPGNLPLKFHKTT